MADLARALEVATAAAAAARALLLAECARPDGPRGEIGSCPADIEAEWIIRNQLLESFPTYGFLGEETAPSRGRDPDDRVWIVDPNDGTTSMQRGYRGHAVSIALVSRGAPVLGLVWAVDAPDDGGDLITWAAGCGPLRRNGAVIQRTLVQAPLTETDVLCVSNGANRNPVGNFACAAPARFIGVPSIAYRLALVAVGECAATMSVNRTQAWDHAAGHALLRGAGGVLVDEHGRELTYDADGHSQSRWVFGGSPSVIPDLLHRPWAEAPHSGFGDTAPPPSLAPVRPVPGRLVHSSDLLRRAQGCLIGQIAGDALGALVEFASAAEIQRRYADGGPRQLAAGGPHQISAGQATDDSELALMLARTLVASSGFDQEAVAVAYARWFNRWTHADTPERCRHEWCDPFDVGRTTAQALGAIDLDDVANGRAATSAMAAASRHSQANGALMRVSPLGIWGAARPPDQVAECARLDARLTHPHPVCQDASAAFAVTLAAALARGLDAAGTYAFAVDWAAAAGVEPAVMAALRAAQAGPPADYRNQQGWVLIALQNAFFQLTHTTSLEAGVVATVRAGGDTDTNAAICGALLGAVYGRAGIPEQWTQMVLTCRPMIGQPGVGQPRPAVYWPVDALVLAERLVTL